MADDVSTAAESPDTDHRLFLLDGMALIYRAHFALIRSPIFNSKGVNTSAVFGFTNTLLDLIENQKPTHIAVAFDTADPTPRHTLYPEYKAQREAMPEDIARAIPAVKRLVKALDIPVLEYPGFEADDVIGTLAKRADAEGVYTTYMVTPDKDFAQLVSKTSVIYKPGRQGSQPEILDLEKIRENWQVESPEQVVDILGLWGDASDNIPGVPGVGEKTAKKLVSQFGSIENLLANTDQLKGKQKENVENHAEQARLSRELAQIILDVPVDVDFHELAIGDKRDDEALKSLFVEFEFNSLGKRLFGDDFAAGRGHSTGTTDEGELVAELKTIADIEKNYRRIPADDAKARAGLIADLEKLKSFCFDVETTGLDEKTAALLGIAFSWENDAGFYVELGEGASVLEEFRAVFENAGIEKIGHNLKFDVSVLHWHGIPVAGILFDTMLAHSLIEPDQRHKMDYLSETYLGYIPIPFDEAFGQPMEKSGQLTMFDDESGNEDTGPDPEKIAQYAAEDADVTWQLSGLFRDKLTEAAQDKVFFDLEAPLLPVLVRMESEGVRVDTDALAEIGEQLAGNMEELKSKIYEAADAEFNLNSPKQVGEILFDRLKLVEKPKKTKTGQYKTDEQTLNSLAAEHEIVANLLAYREASKLKGTYVDTLPEAIFEKTGRVHTTFHQLMTATGRLASNNPNLQNIPIRTAQGREIRKAFVPRDSDHILLAADYSQIELRVMASLSEDPGMMEAFEAGHDIHSITAARVYGVDLEDVIPDMRRTAKMVNFGIIYGISAFGLSQRLRTISRSEAAGIIEEYWRQYPKVKDYMESTIQFAQENGYVETVTGRRRFLRDINSRNGTVRSAAERTAINTPIQGSAADMIKIAMVTVDRELREGGYQSRMILQVHDELVFDLHRDEQDTVIPLVEKAMREALPLNVPVVVETGTGENWLAAH